MNSSRIISRRILRPLTGRSVVSACRVTTPSPRYSRSSWRFKTTDSSAKQPKSMHQEMESVLGNKAVKSDQKAVAAELKAQQNKLRRQQALINAGISFFLVLLSAQVLKTGTQKRKLETQVQVLEEILDSKRDLLKQLETEQTLRPVAEQCAQEIVANQRLNKSASWWGSTASNSKEEQLVEQLVVTLKTEMHRAIGQEAMTQAEKDKTALEELQPAALTESEETDQLLRELGMELEEESDGETVVKKRIFSI